MELTRPFENAPQEDSRKSAILEDGVYTNNMQSIGLAHKSYVDRRKSQRDKNT